MTRDPVLLGRWRHRGADGGRASMADWDSTLR